ncbi:MAG: hypothetical protein HY713_13995 [candidate division NC10 bacterium]|nr:hypothetical protein [candidate division NC10 bacterium]
MTEQELFAKNLRLSREFDLYLLEHPEVAKKIPGNALIVLLPEDDADLCRQNTEIALARRGAGQPVVHVRLGRLAPPKSRLSSAQIEVAA